MVEAVCHELPNGSDLQVRPNLLWELLVQDESSPEPFVLEEDSSPSLRDAGEEEGGVGGEGVAAVVNVGRDVDEDFGGEAVDEVELGVGVAETELNLVWGLCVRGRDKRRSM